MFYLSSFVKIIWKAGTKGFLFVLLSFAVTGMAVQKDFVEKKFFASFHEDEAGSYFYALISAKESYNDVARKLGELPGTMKVEIIAKERLEGEIKTLIDTLKLAAPAQNMDIDYVGMRVMFKKDIKESTINLIREYLVRLVGENNITLGPMRSNLENIRQIALIDILKEWAGVILLIVLSCSWIISFWALRGAAAEYSYIVEQFQRRRYVAFKSILLGVIIVFALASTLFASWGTPLIINLAVVNIVALFSTLIYLRRFAWRLS